MQIKFCGAVLFFFSKSSKKILSGPFGFRTENLKLCYQVNSNKTGSVYSYLQASKNVLIMMHR